MANSLFLFFIFYFFISKNGQLTLNWKEQNINQNCYKQHGLLSLLPYQKGSETRILVRIKRCYREGRNKCNEYRISSWALRQETKRIQNLQINMASSHHQHKSWIICQVQENIGVIKQTNQWIYSFSYIIQQHLDVTKGLRGTN